MIDYIWKTPLNSIIVNYLNSVYVVAEASKWPWRASRDLIAVSSTGFRYVNTKLLELTSSKDKKQLNSDIYQLFQCYFTVRSNFSCPSNDLCMYNVTRVERVVRKDE